MVIFHTTTTTIEGELGSDYTWMSQQRTNNLNIIGNLVNTKFGL